MNYDYQEEQIISLKELFHKLLRHWRKILFCAVLCSGVVLLYQVVFVKTEYTSTAKLYVKSNDIEEVSYLEAIKGNGMFAVDLQYIIKCQPVIDKVIQNLGLSMSYEEFCNHLSVETPYETRIINIMIQHPDEEMTGLMVDEMVKVAVDYIENTLHEEPPVILDRGIQMTEIVDSKITRNVWATFVICIMCSIVFFAINTQRDQTIRTEKDIEEGLGMSVLALMYMEQEKKVSSFPKGVSRKRKNIKNR